jgi:hypothetical protein
MTDYIKLMNDYEDASNRHDVERCTAMFTDDGEIVLNGDVFKGTASIRAAHEFDLASQTFVKFTDLKVQENVVHCTFWNQHELGRAIGDDGMTGSAEFTFDGERIKTFNILPPSEEERARFREKVGTAFKWLRKNHSDTLEKSIGFDRSAGEAIFTLAELWRTHNNGSNS